MNATSLGLALCIGMLLPLQALINAALGRQTGGPVFASLASFCVGTAVLASWWLLSKPMLDTGLLSKVPWWAWTGGLIGALYVVGATLLIPRMGAGPLVCVLILGQIVGSLLLDHFGVLHARQPIDALRVAGALLVVAGVLLVVRPWQQAGA